MEKLFTIAMVNLTTSARIGNVNFKKWKEGSLVIWK